MIRKNFNTHEVPVTYKKFLNTNAESVSNDCDYRLSELEQIKDLAELWLQADLDKRDDRKVELEYVLADALPRIRQETLGSISKIFRQVMHGSRQF